jgi:hypothetical protein
VHSTQEGAALFPSFSKKGRRFQALLNLSASVYNFMKTGVRTL